MDVAQIGKLALEATTCFGFDDCCCGECDARSVRVAAGEDRDMGEALLRELALYGFEVRRAGSP